MSKHACGVLLFPVPYSCQLEILCIMMGLLSSEPLENDEASIMVALRSELGVAGFGVLISECAHRQFV